MSETPESTTPNPEADEALGDGGKKALQNEREARKQAEKHAADLQAQIDAINASKLSDLEKAQAAAAEAQQRADHATREAMRYRLASKHGISEEDARLFLTAETEDAMAEQASRLAAHIAEDSAPRNPLPDPTQGGPSSPIAASTADIFAAAFADRF